MISHNYKLITAATGEPITLQEAKIHLRVNHSEDDTYISSLISAARKKFEKDTSRVCLSSIWEAYYDFFPEYNYEYCANMLLYRCPVTAINSIKYYDDDNVLTTLNVDDYSFDLNGEPGRILIDNIPSSYNKKNAVIINFTSGFSNLAAILKDNADYIFIIYSLIGHFYANRQAVSNLSNLVEVPLTYMDLIKQMKLY